MFFGTAAFQQPKEFTLKLTPQAAEKLLYVVEKSTAEYPVVTEVKGIIIPQFQAQLKDTTNKK